MNPALPSAPPPSNRYAPYVATLAIHAAVLLLAGGVTVFSMPRVQQMMFRAAPRAPAPPLPEETFEIETEVFQEAVGGAEFPPEMLAGAGLSELPLPELPETELFDVAAYRESPRRGDLAGASLAAAPFEGELQAADALARTSATQFFGVRERTASVVVIWDVTRSMMNVAGREGYERVRAEVARLVRELNPDTLFSVIVFAGGVERFRDTLVYASKKERDAAVAWIEKKNTASARSPDGTRGANRSDWALRDAFRMGPEVIYLVTDGEPFYSAGRPIPPDEIYRMTDRLQRERGIRARLHVIGFGTDKNPATRTFLQGLARRNQGVFREIPSGTMP